MSDSSRQNSLRVDYAWPDGGVKRRRSFNFPALAAFIGSLVYLPITLLGCLGVMFGAGGIHLASAVWAPIAVLIVAARGIVQVRRCKLDQRGTGFAIWAIIVALATLVPIVALSDVVRDRRMAHTPYAQSMLTLNGSWTPPANAKVIHARFVGYPRATDSWYEIQMPSQFIRSYRFAVLAKFGKPSITGAGASAPPLFADDRDPGWWDLRRLPDADGMWFDAIGDAEGTRFIFSAKRGIVYVHADS